MSSIHRIGVTIAGLATAVVVAGVFVAQGYVAAQQATPQETAQAAGRAAGGATLAPETVYVNPAPTPPVIRVTQTSPPGQPPVVHVIVPSQGGDDGGSDG